MFVVTVNFSRAKVYNAARAEFRHVIWKERSLFPRAEICHVIGPLITGKFFNKTTKR